jgi:hypothetical protein
MEEQWWMKDFKRRESSSWQNTSDVSMTLLIALCIYWKSRLSAGKVKVKFSLYRPWRALGLREVEVPTFSDIRLIDGVKVVSPTRRPIFTPRKIPGTHFC